MAKTLDPAAPTALEPFPAGAHPLDWRKSGLPGFAKKICRAVAEAILADEDERGELVAPDDATLDRVIHKLDLWLGTGSSQLASGFVALTLAVESLPIVIIRKPSRMTRLSLADRVRFLEKLEEHPSGLMSMLLVAFKIPLATAAYEEAPLLHETGFDRENLTVRRKLDVLKDGAT